MGKEENKTLTPAELKALDRLKELKVAPPPPKNILKQFSDWLDDWLGDVSKRQFPSEDSIQ